MPNRIIKESACYSETLDLLSGDEERFFFRLTVQCDDYGRFDARPAIVRSRCFQLHPELASEMQVRAWLARLVEVDLVRLYEVDGRPYLQITAWSKHQQTRAKASKYPQPPAGAPHPPASASSRNQAPADASERAHMSPYPEAITRSDTREANPGSGSESDSRAPEALAPPAVPDEPTEWMEHTSSDGTVTHLPKRSVEPQPAPKPKPRRDRFAECLDAIEALDPDVVIGGDDGRNAKAVNAAKAEPALIAEAYVALMHGEWQDAFLAKRASLHAVVDCVGGYVNHKRRAVGPAPPAPPPDPPDDEISDQDRRAVLAQAATEREAARQQEQQRRARREAEGVKCIECPARVLDGTDHTADCPLGGLDRAGILAYAAEHPDHAGVKLWRRRQERVAQSA